MIMQGKTVLHKPVSKALLSKELETEENPHLAFIYQNNQHQKIEKNVVLLEVGFTRKTTKQHFSCLLKCSFFTWIYYKSINLGYLSAGEDALIRRIVTLFNF